MTGNYSTRFSMRSLAACPPVRRIAGVGALGLFVGALLGLGAPEAPSSTAPSEKPDAPAPILLDQGWSPDDRVAYHRTSQGSAVIPYDLFVSLEQAGSANLFRADEISDRYGLIPAAAEPRTNPDGLPIGLVRTSVPSGRWKGDWLGLTCSACHSSELHYQGKRVRIEGGGSQTFDFVGYISTLNDALKATQADAAKFDRTAVRMKVVGDAARAALRKSLDEAAGVVDTYITRDTATSTPIGPGRMDALTLIHTRALAIATRLPENWEAALAPVNPPFLWNAPQSSWVQWSGVAADPLVRNATESLGVFIRVDLVSRTPEEGLFESTMDLRGQVKVESLLRRLAPPKWPEDVFGAIDRAKASRGRELFVENCAQCHSTYPHRWSSPKVDGKRFIENALVPEAYVGTDPQQFRTPAFNPQPDFLTGSLAPYLKSPYTGAALAPSALLIGVAHNQTIALAAKKAGFTPEELVDAHGFRFDWEEPPSQASFKAGPRDGVWATAPYLHNGSVPSLYDLLLPAKDRPKQFMVGRDFDPVKVGIDTTGASGKFLLDTTKIGNSNMGHSFEHGPLGAGVVGRLLSDDERWAIVEYLKSIPTEPAQIAPFGGPADAVEAWRDVRFFNNMYPEAYTMPVPPLALGEERVLPGEDALIAEFIGQTMARMKIQYPVGAEVRRDAHPKTHGLVQAKFEVLGGLPGELRHGIFASPKTYDAMVRFSASGTEVNSDTVSQAHGMAIKVLGVPGAKVLADERDAATQDFVMINYPTFLSSNVADYAAFHTARVEGLKASEVFFKISPKALKAVEGLNGGPFWNPLQARYFSQTPYRLGPGAMKFSARPMATPAKPAKIDPSQDYLRQAMVAQIGAEEVVFEFLVQRQLDPVKQPVEDSLAEWQESEAPFVRVAILRIPKQDLSTGLDLKVAENLSFTPWHALPEQAPLGGINRTRKVAYETISKYRHQQNGVPRVEP
ncbi:MAG: di-heme-cytochrome C peroxidase [Planctomycetota bacterium]